MLSASILCLAAVGFYEARSEPFMDQIAVMYSVQNRVEQRFQETHCMVVHEPGAYSYLWDDIPDVVLAEERVNYGDAIRGAILVYFKLVPDPTCGATDYHERATDPEWPYIATLKTKSFIFYKRTTAQ